MSLVISLIMAFISFIQMKRRRSERYPLDCTTLPSSSEWYWGRTVGPACNVKKKRQLHRVQKVEDVMWVDERLHLLTCIHIKRLVWVWIGSHLLGGQSRADKKFSTTFWSLPVLKKWQKIKSIDASEIGLGYESKYSLQHWFYISTFHDSPTSQIDIIWHFLKIAKGRQGEKVEYWLWLITWERRGRRGIVGWAPSCLWQSPVN